jgi:ABC-type multidrug transport system ATPase subunit
VSFAFSAEAFWKTFGRRPVLRNAGVWAEPGVVTVLLGRNGSGKSTLFRCALGFLRGDGGVVLLDGTRYLRPRLAELAARGLFFLPDRDLLATGFSLRQHLTAVRHRFAHADVDGAVERLGLGQLLDRRPHALSGGERRRADIALVEARNPAVLIADEPLRGLSPVNADFVAGRIRALADGGCAVIASGHESRALLDLADQVIWMTGGTTHALGSPAAARAHHQFRQEYLAEFHG